MAGKTASAATSFTLDDLKALKLSVLPTWRANGSWVFGTNAYALLDGLKDDNGQYLWQPSNIAGEANSLLGKPIYKDAGLPDITTGTKGAVIFGDVSQYTCATPAPSSSRPAPVRVDDLRGHVPLRQVGRAQT